MLSVGSRGAFFGKKSRYRSNEKIHIAPLLYNYEEQGSNDRFVVRSSRHSADVDVLGKSFEVEREQ